MKPLELTIYETDATGRYMCGDGVTYAAEAVDEFASWNRLTDAELAAEYWAVATEYTRTSAQVFYEERATGNTHLMRHYKTIGKQQDTMHRFATSPHYCEEAA